MIQCWKCDLLRTESKLAQKMVDLEQRDFRVMHMIPRWGNEKESTFLIQGLEFST